MRGFAPIRGEFDMSDTEAGDNAKTMTIIVTKGTLDWGKSDEH